MPSKSFLIASSSSSTLNYWPVEKTWSFNHFLIFVALHHSLKSKGVSFFNFLAASFMFFSLSFGSSASKSIAWISRFSRTYSSFYVSPESLIITAKQALVAISPLSCIMFKWGRIGSLDSCKSIWRIWMNSSRASFLPKWMICIWMSLSINFFTASLEKSLFVSIIFEEGMLKVVESKLVCSRIGFPMRSCKFFISSMTFLEKVYKYFCSIPFESRSLSQIKLRRGSLLV